METFTVVSLAVIMFFGGSLATWSDDGDDLTGGPVNDCTGWAYETETSCFQLFNLKLSFIDAMKKCIDYKGSGAVVSSNILANDDPAYQYIRDDIREKLGYDGDFDQFVWSGQVEGGNFFLDGPTMCYVLVPQDVQDLLGLEPEITTNCRHLCGFVCEVSRVPSV